MEKLALITGATSGIGKAYAYELARMGYDLILTGRRKEVIAEVATALHKQYGIKVTICLVDFTNRQQTARFMDYVKQLDNVDLLINNAGYGADKPFCEDDFAHQQDMLTVHNQVVVELTHIVANKMKKHGRGYIIQVSSLASYLMLPKSAMYCATKAFLTNFSQSLALELKPFGIKVQVLCPGFVHTDFHSKLAIDEKKCRDKGPVKWMDATDVVKHSLKSLQKEWAVVCIPGTWNKIGYHLVKYLPKDIYYRVVLDIAPYFSKHK